MKLTTIKFKLIVIKLYLLILRPVLEGFHEFLLPPARLPRGMESLRAVSSRSAHRVTTNSKHWAHGHTS